MTTVVISQPMYFPWPGFLAQMALADVVVWLVDVQFSKGSFTNRVQARLPSGMTWLSIPLDGKGSHTPINELAAARPGWLDAHVATLAQSFHGAPHATEALDIAASIADQGKLSDQLVASCEALLRACGARVPPSSQSTDLGVPGHGSDRVLKIVQAMGGSRYLTGHGARNYLDHAAFETAGITVDYMDYAPQPWPQPGAFTPYVTGLDLVARVAPEHRLAHLNPRTRGWHDFLASHG